MNVKIRGGRTRSAALCGWSDREETFYDNRFRMDFFSGLFEMGGSGSLNAAS
jgi:hypothetical protein